ncbi:MAG: diguanylate cyclase [Candidatus Firestonebacteria bacterium]|nr:diguanylate cyclase [Candidatus Firestonebacteria bacterium]
MGKKYIIILNNEKTENDNITSSLANFNYKIEISNIDEYKKTIINRPPDLIIADIINKNELKGQKEIPIIFLTTHFDKEYYKEIHNELIEYINRPYNIQELVIRVNQLLWIKNLENELKNKNHELEKVNLTDKITNLYNPTYLLERFEEEIIRAQRYNYPLSCIMVNIDNIDKITQTYDENFISAILKETANLLRKAIRVVDIIGHYKTGCFVIILPQTIFKGANVLGERIRNIIEKHSFIINDNVIKIKVSIAVGGKDVFDKHQSLLQLSKVIETLKTKGGNQVGNV